MEGMKQSGSYIMTTTVIKEVTKGTGQLKPIKSQSAGRLLSFEMLKKDTLKEMDLKDG